MHKISGPAAEVRVDLGATINMGNMEFLRVGLSLTMPCEASASKIEETYKKATKWVETKLDKMIQEAKPKSQPSEDILS
jgi:predicted metal-dependent hydrolase